MTVTNDDLPHPVPPTAFLRYKENWFFIVLDQEQDVFGVIHVSSEPGFDRIRYACHLRISGELFAYSNETSFPSEFAFATELGDGTLAVRFVEAHERMEVSLHDGTIDMEMSFLRRAPQFCFLDYDDANPDVVSVQEIINFSTRQQYVHQQQGMVARGTVSIRSGEQAGRSIEVDALGYRDHTRGIRCDNMTLEHYWTGLHLPRHVFGAMSVTGVLRPESPGRSGYVHDDEGGLRPLRQVELHSSGSGPDGLAAQVELRLTDIHDEPFTIVADLTQRISHVPFRSEKPGAAPFIYDIVENFVPITLLETGETGVGLVEIGWSTPQSSRS